MNSKQSSAVCDVMTEISRLSPRQLTTSALLLMSSAAAHLSKYDSGEIKVIFVKWAQWPLPSSAPSSRQLDLLQHKTFPSNSSQFSLQTNKSFSSHALSVTLWRFLAPSSGSLLFVINWECSSWGKDRLRIIKRIVVVYCTVSTLDDLALGHM